MCFQLQKCDYISVACCVPYLVSIHTFCCQFQLLFLSILSGIQLMFLGKLKFIQCWIGITLIYARVQVLHTQLEKMFIVLK
jgi:hypothetical protein